MKIQRAFAALAVIALLTAGDASADEDARELFRRAQALYALGKFPEAAPLFERAFELHTDPALLYNAAQAHRLAGNKARALTLYQSYLRHYGSGQPNHDEVVALVAQLSSAVESERRATSSPPVTITPLGPPPPQTLGQAAAAAAPREDERPPPRQTRKRTWLWVTIGGAAVAVVAVSVGLGVGLGGQPVAPRATYTAQGN